MVSLPFYKRMFLVPLISVPVLAAELAHAQSDVVVVGRRQLALDLVSPDVRTREAALAELNSARRRAKGAFDLEGKFVLFQQIVSLDSPNYVYRASYLLAKLRAD